MRKWWIVGALAIIVLGVLLFRERTDENHGGWASTEGPIQVDEPGSGSHSDSTPDQEHEDSTSNDLAARAALRRLAGLPLAELRVKVVCADEGEPVAGATIKVSTMDRRTETSTDLQGEAVFQLEPAAYKLEIGKPGYLLRVFTVGIPRDWTRLSRIIELDHSVIVQGRVKNQHGAGVAGARIVATPAGSDESPGSGLPSRSVAHSEADGFFSLMARSGTYEVQATKAPHRPGKPLTVEFVPQNSPPLELTIIETNRTVELSGSVTSVEGSPVERARIRAWAQGRRGGLINQTETDVAGEFHLEAYPASSVRVSAQAPGFQEQSKEISLKQDASAHFVLTEFQTFSVRVFDRQLNEVQGARVYGESLEGGRVLRRLDDGRYYSLQYPVLIYSDGLPAGLGVTEGVLVESYKPEIRLYFRPGASLSGRVTDLRGEPIRSFQMRLQYVGGRQFGHTVHSEDGSFFVVDLPSGRVQLTFGSAGFDKIRRDAMLNAGQTEGIEISLSPSGGKPAASQKTEEPPKKPQGPLRP